MGIKVFAKKKGSNEENVTAGDVTRGQASRLW
jgi:hypothetical protein